MTIASVYPLYVAKVERKGTSKEDVPTGIYFLKIISGESIIYCRIEKN